MGGLNEILEHNLQNRGGNNLYSKGGTLFRNVYPAQVEDNNDPLEQDRIRVRITGRDKDTPNTYDLPWCVPLKSSFLYNKPRVGEMVFVLLEDPKDNTGIRYWVGPIHTTRYDHKIEPYSSAKNIFKNTLSSAKPKISDIELNKLDIPQGLDVALEGRDDAWVTLRPKEVRLVAGAFEKGTLSPNRNTPAFISVSQKENTDDVKLSAYSRTEITSSVINLYSHLGKFRDQGMKKFEINEDLDSFGSLSNSLSPTVKGDELIKFADLLVRFCLEHIHTPQKSHAKTALSEQLSRYTVDGELQKLISSYIRIN